MIKVPVGVKRIGARMTPEYDNRYTKYQWILYSNTRVTREHKAMVQKILKMSILYSKAFKDIYHGIKFWNSAMNRCFIKKLFLKTSQYSLENTCLGVFFDKMQALSPATLLKRDSNTGVFLCIFKNTYFEEHL